MPDLRESGRVLGQTLPHAPGSGGPDGSLCLPWIGPRYTPGGVAIVALNMNISPEDNTDRIYEYWISYEQHIHWLAAGYQKNDGSRFAFGAHRSAAALLDAQTGRPVVDRLPEQLPDAVLSTARLQAVKCLPKRASSKPSSAMRQLCVPMVLIDELDVVRPGTVLVLGAVAYEGGHASTRSGQCRAARAAACAAAHFAAANGRPMCTRSCTRPTRAVAQRRASSH